MFKELINSVLAGISISIGGTVFLLCESRIVGALLFTVGLFNVCVFGFSLFTGKVCYVFDNDKRYALRLPVIWLGNLVGSVLIAFLEMQSSLFPALVEKAKVVCEAKLSQSLFSAFVLAFLCNILIYIAVEGYKTIPHAGGKYLALFFGVMVFVLCGFEHCVANMYYFSIGQVWSGRTILYLLVMTLGNVVGGVFIPLIRKMGK